MYMITITPWRLKKVVRNFVNLVKILGEDVYPIGSALNS
jgi:hypothetical protein